MTFKFDPETNVVLCMRVENGPSHTPAVVKVCAKCHAQVWMGIALLEEMQKMESEIVPLCNLCGIVEIPSDAELDMLPAQREELMALGLDPDAAFESAKRFIATAKQQQKKADA